MDLEVRESGERLTQYGEVVPSDVPTQGQSSVWAVRG
ncbi:hypothetical protein BKA22_001630 [Cellulomonas soli]|nr:hypothetical protein [Cellulomonas soli]